MNYKLKRILELLWWNGPGMISKYQVTVPYIFNNPLNRNFRIRTIMKVLWWKTNRAFFKFPVIVQLTSKIKCICYPDNSLYSTLVLYSTFPEYGEMTMVEKLLKEDDIFLDVGANIGVYSLIAASKITSGKIYAFEPSVNCLPNLYENISLNQIGDRVQVIEKVVSDKTGFLDFDISSVSDYNHISYSKNRYSNSEKAIMKLPSIALDDFILENKIPHIKLIKIDVEGTELLVLRGLQKSLKSQLVDILIVEVSGWTSKRFAFSPKEVFKFLKECDFNLYYFDPKCRLKKFNKTLEGTWNIIAIHKSKMHIL